jgi:hypothetical protein
VARFLDRHLKFTDVGVVSPNPLVLLTSLNA